MSRFQLKQEHIGVCNRMLNLTNNDLKNFNSFDNNTNRITKIFVSYSNKSIIDTKRREIFDYILFSQVDANTC